MTDEDKTVEQSGYVHTVAVYDADDSFTFGAIDGDIIIEHKTYKSRLPGRLGTLMLRYRIWRQRRRWTAAQRDAADRVAEMLDLALIHGDGKHRL